LPVAAFLLIACSPTRIAIETVDDDSSRSAQGLILDRAIVGDRQCKLSFDWA
jgi:hypothetical protein